jgi:hypothetical protein
MSWIGLIGMSGKKKNEPSVSSPESLKFDEWNGFIRNGTSIDCFFRGSLLIGQCLNCRYGWHCFFLLDISSRILRQSCFEDWKVAFLFIDQMTNPNRFASVGRRRDGLDDRQFLELIVTIQRYWIFWHVYQNSKAISSLWSFLRRNDNLRFIDQEVLAHFMIMLPLVRRSNFFLW